MPQPTEITHFIFGQPLSATPACPGGQTGTSRARRSVAREGTARRARGPPVRYRDKPDPIPQRCPFLQVDRQAGTKNGPQPNKETAFRQSRVTSVLTLFSSSR